PANTTLVRKSTSRPPELPVFEHRIDRPALRPPQRASRPALPVLRERCNVPGRLPEKVCERAFPLAVCFRASPRIRVAEALRKPAGNSYLIRPQFYVGK